MKEAPEEPKIVDLCILSERVLAELKDVEARIESLRVALARKGHKQLAPYLMRTRESIRSCLKSYEETRGKIG